MNNVILIGRNGTISNRILSLCPYKIITTSSSGLNSNFKLDLRKIEYDKISYINENDIVLLPAGVSSPDECNKNYEKSKVINLDGTKNLIKYCIDNNAHVIFFSSDSVYGDTTLDTTLSESDNINPNNNYAEMKAEIENAFDIYENFLSLRISYVISNRDNFSSYLYKSFLNNDVVEIFHPLYRKAIWINDLVYFILQLIKSWPSKINTINIGGTKLMSRLDIFDCFNKNANNKLKYRVKKPSEEFYQARSEIININTDLMQSLFDLSLTDIDTAYVKEFNINEKN